MAPPFIQGYVCNHLTVKVSNGLRRGWLSYTLKYVAVLRPRLLIEVDNEKTRVHRRVKVPRSINSVQAGSGNWIAMPPRIE